MVKTVVGWKFVAGAPIKADPEQAAEAIRDVAVGDSIALDALVRAARAKSHPLHEDFEWDNDLAAREYRLTQARRIVRSLRVVYLNEAGEEKVGRAVIAVRLVSVPEEDRPAKAVGRYVYFLREKIESTPSLRDAAIEDAVRMLRAAKSRIADIESCGEVVEHIQKALAFLETVQQREVTPPTPA